MLELLCSSEHPIKSEESLHPASLRFWQSCSRAGACCGSIRAAAYVAGLASLLKGGYFPSIGQLRSGHVGMLIAVNGTVMRTSAAQVLEATRHYECDRCGYQ